MMAIAKIMAIYFFNVRNGGALDPKVLFIIITLCYAVLLVISSYFILRWFIFFYFTLLYASLFCFVIVWWCCLVCYCLVVLFGVLLFCLLLFCFFFSLSSFVYYIYPGANKVE